MIFDDFRREATIRRTLRALARQRVAIVLQPGNVWVIEKAIEENSDTDAILKTCYLRGWVEPVEDALPKGRLMPEGNLPDGNIFSEFGPVYRLSDSGWSIINRSHQWFMMSIFVAVLALIATLIAFTETQQYPYAQPP